MPGFGDLEKLYQLVYNSVEAIISGRLWFAGWLVAIGVGAAVVGLARFAGARERNFYAALVLACVFSLCGMTTQVYNVGSVSADIAKELANKGIDAGVSMAQNAHATQLQYIQAPIVGFDVDTINCKRVVMEHSQGVGGECQTRVGYYSTSEVEIWYEDVKHCSTDSDTGKETCTHETVRHHKDEYVPWLTQIVRYKIKPDAYTKYLLPAVYEMVSAGPKDNPWVYITGWQAPENPKGYPGAYGVGSVNSTVPEFWARVRASSGTGGTVVVGTFAGAYFNWLTASEAAQAQVYAGHYNEMKKFVSFPGPRGVSINYINAYDKPDVMNTDLTSKDGGMAFDFDPVTALGVDIPGDLMTSLNSTAIEFQGHAGKNKQSVFRWFIVSSQLVEQMGGVENVTSALKAYLADTTIFGKFNLPKNLVIIVTVVDSSMTIVGRDMATALPFGNVIVMRDVRASIKTSEGLPLTPGNMIGRFNGRYSGNNGGVLVYDYAPALADAGSVAGLIYQVTPGYTEPDPSSDECTAAPPEHKGYVRSQMCKESYRKSNIPLNQADAELIKTAMDKEAEVRIWLFWQWTICILGLCVLVADFAVEMQNSR